MLRPTALFLSYALTALLSGSSTAAATNSDNAMITNGNNINDTLVEDNYHQYIDSSPVAAEDSGLAMLLQQANDFQLQGRRKNKNRNKRKRGGNSSSNSINIQLNKDGLHTAQIQVGTKNRKSEKPYTVGVTSQGSHLWLFSEAIQAAATKDGFDHHYYENEGEFNSNKDFAIGYADGSSYSGEVGRETVDVAGKTLKDVDLGLVKDLKTGSNTHLDGTFGLGITDNVLDESVETKPLFTRFMQDRNKNMFSFHIPASGGLTSGVITFGELDEAHYEADSLNFVNLQPDYPGWVVQASKVTVGNAKLATNVDIEVDFGSARLGAPRSFIEQMIKYTRSKWEDDKKNSVVMMDVDGCEEADKKLPSLFFFFAGKKEGFELSPSSLFEKSSLLPSGKVSKKKWLDVCRLSIYPTDDSDSKAKWVLGLPFFRQAVTIYDLDKRRVGFATPKADYANSEDGASTAGRKKRRTGGTSF